MFAPRSGWTNRFGLSILVLSAALVLIDRLGPWPQTRPLANTLYSWVLLLGAFTLLLGVANVAWVHLRRVLQGQEEWVLSSVLLVTLAGVLVVGVLSPGGTTSVLMEWVFDSVIFPAQATLFALTAFFVLGAAYRFLRLTQPGSLWILAGTLITLLVQTPLSRASLPPLFTSFADWLLVWPVMAALRGALLGLGLAAILTGLRLLVQND